VISMVTAKPTLQFTGRVRAFGMLLDPPARRYIFLHRSDCRPIYQPSVILTEIPRPTSLSGDPVIKDGTSFKVQMEALSGRNLGQLVTPPREAISTETGLTIWRFGGHQRIPFM
jgi:hypothetical protein